VFVSESGNVPAVSIADMVEDEFADIHICLFRVRFFVGESRKSSKEEQANKPGQYCGFEMY
jgi:hypothetical protein